MQHKIDKDELHEKKEFDLFLFLPSYHLFNEYITLQKQRVHNCKINNEQLTKNEENYKVKFYYNKQSINSEKNRSLIIKHAINF